MNLAVYLRKNNIRPAAFARKIGSPKTTISRILLGQRRPGYLVMQRISKATGGRVRRVEDFEPMPRDDER